MAFVLPRVVLSGADWQTVREFLAREGSFKYIVVSDDPSHNWAWSENTVLSEVLLIYVKSRSGSAGNNTIVVYVRKKPKSALEAKIYADLIKAVSSKVEVEEDFSATREVPIRGNTAMYIYKVRRKAVIRSAAINLNLVAGFHTSYLSRQAYTLFHEKSFLGARIPLLPLKNYVMTRPYLKSLINTRSKGARRKKVAWDHLVGYDVANIRRKCLNKGAVPLRLLDALNMDTYSRLRIKEESLKLTYTNENCLRRAGRLTIAGVARFWLPTVSVVAAYSDDPIISQVAWTVPLSEEEAKIQVLWLNSTPGLLHFLSLRQDSKGGFIQLKKKLLGELLVLKTDSLTAEIRQKLLETFNEVADIELGTLHEQLEESMRREGARYQIDCAILEVLGIDLEKNREAWNFLKETYRELMNETLFLRSR